MNFDWKKYNELWEKSFKKEPLTDEEEEFLKEGYLREEYDAYGEV